MFWMDSNDYTQFWGTKLTSAELEEFTNGKDIHNSAGKFTLTETGFGPFRIRLLLPGDRFTDIQGRTGIMMKAYADDNFDVALFPETIRTTLQRWIGSAVVYVRDTDVARQINRRQRGRVIPQQTTEIVESVSPIS
jgi:hypothetical protein